MLFFFWFVFEPFVFVRQCRQAKISYSGAFVADVCFQYNDGPVIRERFHLGQFPVMLKVGALLAHLLGIVSFLDVNMTDHAPTAVFFA